MSLLKVKIFDEGDIVILQKGAKEIVFYKSDAFWGYGNLLEDFDSEKFFIQYRSFGNSEFSLVLCKRHCYLSQDVSHLVGCRGVEVLMLVSAKECWACGSGALFYLCRQCRNVVVEEIRNTIRKNLDFLEG